MAHRFRTVAPRNTTASGYGSSHIKARKAAALLHQPTDPCTRCGHPLGVMGPWLHLDHTPDRQSYLGFAHGSRPCPICRVRCNIVAGAREGNRRQRAARPEARRNWYAATGRPVQSHPIPATGLCCVCGSSYVYSHAEQKTCGRTCGLVYRYGRGPVCRVEYADCQSCGRCYVKRGGSVYCSAPCKQEGRRAYAREWSRRPNRERYREAHGIPLDAPDQRPGPRTAHGTPARYRRGCRCGECRQANAERAREYRQRRASLGASF